MSTIYYRSVLLLAPAALALLGGCVFPVKGDTVEILVDRYVSDSRTLKVTLIYDEEIIDSIYGGEAEGLVVYSLGYSACVSSAQSFAGLLAQRGYVVAIPDHNDIIKVCQSIPEGLEQDGAAVEGTGLLPDDGTAAFYAGIIGQNKILEDEFERFFCYRNVDLIATIGYLTQHEHNDYGSLQDKPVFLVGYSLGGWNALNIAGAAALYPELRCEVTAVICENAFVGELSEERMCCVTCPVFYLVGTEDVLLTEVRQLYDWRPSNSRMVEIKGADHYVFALDLCGSPILSAWQSGSCTESALMTASKTNELIVEFISAMTATAEIPMLEDLSSLDPDVFTVVK